jgi:hypothetical protein
MAIDHIEDNLKQDTTPAKAAEPACRPFFHFCRISSRWLAIRSAATSTGAA